MGQGKDAFLERYGGLRADESPTGRKARLSEINRLETDLKTGKIRGDKIESVQRRLCELKGIYFDSYDDPND